MEQKPSYKTKLKDITTFIFDVDGVLTDGTVILSSSGEMVRTMHTRDGYAMRKAIDNGLNICIISGGNSEMVRKRLEFLGVKDIYLNASNKVEVFNNYLASQQLKPENILYMGDDLPDYEVMKKCAIATCPNDAAPEILSISDYVSHKKGGEGCVRDVIEQVMKIKGCWEI